MTALPQPKVEDSSTGNHRICHMGDHMTGLTYCGTVVPDPKPHTLAECVAGHQLCVVCADLAGISW